MLGFFVVLAKSLFLAKTFNKPPFYYAQDLHSVFVCIIMLQHPQNQRSCAQTTNP